MRYAIPAAVLLGICACYGGFGKDSPVGDGGIPSATGIGVDGGDGGLDGGDAGTDGGFDAGSDGGFACDAGGGIANANVVDDCFGATGLSVAASVTYNQNCTASITFASGSSPCSGNISSPTNSFQGSCAGPITNSCAAPSLPGTITCEKTATATCTIKVCAGTCGP